MRIRCLPRRWRLNQRRKLLSFAFSFRADIGDGTLPFRRGIQCGEVQTKGLDGVKLSSCFVGNLEDPLRNGFRLLSFGRV